MEWFDDGIVLSSRPHGENAAIVTLLTAQHGCYSGLLPGGQGRKARSILQPGNHVKARWRARLLDHLGSYSLEVITAHAAKWLDNKEIIAIITSACSVTGASLPDRQPVPGIYSGLLALLGWPDPALWAPAYVKWEVELLCALGYGLDFSKCAVNGTDSNLFYISPRTGRAVSYEAAAPYREKLFKLPGFLKGTSETWTTEDIVNGLALTGHFLSRYVFYNQHSYPVYSTGKSESRLPPARERLANIYYERLNSSFAG